MNVFEKASYYILGRTPDNYLFKKSKHFRPIFDEQWVIERKRAQQPMISLEDLSGVLRKNVNLLWSRKTSSDLFMLFSEIVKWKRRKWHRPVLSRKPPPENEKTTKKVPKIKVRNQFVRYVGLEVRWSVVKGNLPLGLFGDESPFRWNKHFWGSHCD